MNQMTEYLMKVFLATVMQRDWKGGSRFYWEIGFRHLMLQVSFLALKQLTALLTTGIALIIKRVLSVAVTKPNQIHMRPAWCFLLQQGKEH